MAIRQLLNCIVYSPAEQTLLVHLQPYTKDTWEEVLIGKDRGSLAKLKLLKKSIRITLKAGHGLFCSYCGLVLNTTSRDEIDHIAPKAKYPEFSFESNNLALACSLCNGFTKKDDYDTISIYSNKYNNCSFRIVHPYFDDVKSHYEFINTENGVPAIIKLLSSKAIESNKLFNLDSPEMTSERIKDGLLKLYPITQNDNDLIRQILMSNRSA